MRSTGAVGKLSGRRAEFPRRVLVIDNEPLVRWSLTAGLRDAGLEAVSTGDANEARALASRRPPDAVLLDARLWDTDPTILLRDLLAAAPGCRILILAVEGQELALPGGDVDIVTKPFDLNAVVQRVQAALTPAVKVARAVS